MTNVTLSRLGQINGTGDALESFLKIFGAEVLTEFKRRNVFEDKHFVRSIKNGKSASFPMVGRASSGYHTPGNYIQGSQIMHGERVITVDQLLVSAVTIASIDEAMNHYDVRSVYVEEVVQELAKTYDQNVARNAILAARSSSGLTGRPGGARIVNAAMLTDAEVLEASLFQAMVIFDEKNVSEMDRNAFLRPAQYALLAQREKLLNKEIGGTGSIASGKLETVAGISLVKSNHVPNANFADAAFPSKYHGNFASTAGVIMNKHAVGTVKLLDLAVESDWEPRTQSYFTVAKYAVGHGVLRAECAIELANAAL